MRADYSFRSKHPNFIKLCSYILLRNYTPTRLIFLCIPSLDLNSKISISFFQTKQFLLEHLHKRREEIVTIKACSCRSRKHEGGRISSMA